MQLFCVSTVYYPTAPVCFFNYVFFFFFFFFTRVYFYFRFRLAHLYLFVQMSFGGSRPENTRQPQDSGNNCEQEAVHHNFNHNNGSQHYQNNYQRHSGNPTGNRQRMMGDDTNASGNYHAQSRGHGGEDNRRQFGGGTNGSGMRGRGGPNYNTGSNSGAYGQRDMRGGRGGGGGGYGQFQQPQSGYYNPTDVPTNNTYHREVQPDDDLFKDQSPGINFDEYDSIEVSLSPNDVAPAETFADMNLEPALRENVKRCRYPKPTPVQKYGIPVVLSGRDLMACAQTGSGKTAAYLIPAINYMLANNCSRRGEDNNMTKYPSALVLAPTRELGIQISEEGRKFTFHTGIRSVVVYGGADPRHQISEVGRGCGLLVATPGRLLDLFNRGYIGFANIQFLVLDEADRMLDMGFEPQIRQIVIRSDMPPPGKRQTLLYSATFPKEIQQLAREFLHNHSFLQIGRVGSTTANIKQDVQWVEDRQKLDKLFEILEQREDRHILIFVERKSDADQLERCLSRAGQGVMAIHGDRGQRDREQALGAFKSGMRRILVATDVASRGLDIPDVGVVIQYDLPSNIDDYVHRIGRTGRAGKEGTAISFFNEKNRNIVDALIPLLKETNQVIIPQVQLLAKAPVQPPPSRGRRGGGMMSTGVRGGAPGMYGNGRFVRGGRGGPHRDFTEGRSEAYGGFRDPYRSRGGANFDAPMHNKNYRYSAPMYTERTYEKK